MVDGTTIENVGPCGSWITWSEMRRRYSSVVCGSAARSCRVPSGMRSAESAGTLSSAGGAKFCSVSVSVAVVAEFGAGNVTVPLTPCDDGSGAETGPPPGVRLSALVLEVTDQNGELPVFKPGRLDVPP